MMPCVPIAGCRPLKARSVGANPAGAATQIEGTVLAHHTVLKTVMLGGTLGGSIPLPSANLEVNVGRAYTRLLTEGSRKACDSSSLTSAKQSFISISGECGGLLNQMSVVRFHDGAPIRFYGRVTRHRIATPVRLVRIQHEPPNVMPL